jgi:hypothetical protein
MTARNLVAPYRIVSGALAALALGMGCASSPKAPSEQLAATTASERAATEVGAAGVPQAALYLQLATEQTEQAKLLAQKGENTRAQRVLERAQADAELALAMARAEQERTAAEHALSRVQQLQKTN